MEKTVKMTKFEKDLLGEIVHQEMGLHEVIASTVKMGTKIAQNREAFWNGVRSRLGLGFGHIIKADLKTGNIRYKPEKKDVVFDG